MPDLATNYDTLSHKELLDKRLELHAAQRALLDKAEGEKRDLTSDEQEQFDRRFEDIDTIGGLIKAKDAARRNKDRMADLDQRLADAPRHLDRPQEQDRDRRDAKTIKFELRGQTYEYRADSPDEIERKLYQRGVPDYQGAFRTYLLRGEGGLSDAERRALQADNNAEGGFLTTTQFVARLIQAVDDIVFVRRYATVLPLTNATSVGAPSLDTDLDDFDWTTELQTGNEDTALRFGKRELTPHPLAKRIKVSKKLIRASVMSIEDIILQRLRYKVALTEEKAFLTGNGNQKPLGVFTASDDGVPTSRDVSTDNTTTAMTPDGLLNAKFHLKGQYHGEARWMFHRDAVKQITKFKDGNGQYIWQPGMVAGQPDRLFNLPVDQSEYAPNTFTTGLYVGGLFAWSHYWIADSLNMSIQRLVELYAETNQDGFIARKETDGMPTLAEAFVRIKLA